MYVCMCVYVCMYMHELYTYSCMHVYIYIYIYIFRNIYALSDNAVFDVNVFTYKFWDLVRSDFEVKSLRLTSKALNCLLQSWVVLHLLSTRA